MSLWKAVIQRIDALNQRIGKIVAWFNVPIMIIIMVDVFLRRFFNVGSVVLQELEWHFHALLFLFAAAYTYQMDGHVRIDILYSRLSDRSRAWVELIGCLIFLLPYTAIIGWLSIGFVDRSWAIGEVSDAPGGLPYRWLVKIGMPLAFLLLFLQGWSVAMKKIILLFGNRTD